MNKSHNDIIIIGAGIVGSSIALELSKKNKKVFVLEAKKISSQTSKASSKMLHGGIRYLENLDFMLVFEALKEKNFWIKNKPHLAKEAVFYLPVYKESKWPLIAMKLAVFLYNLLSGFKNKTYPSLNKKKMVERFPMIKKEGLRGAAAYSDAVIDDEFFTIELANEAKKNGSEFFEDTEVLKISKENALYTITTTTGIFTCKQLIVACGPFTDQLMRKYNSQWESMMLLSKGSHLWIKKQSLPIKSNIVLQTKDNRVIFIIDHQDKVLVGTTEKVINDNELVFDLMPSEDEVQYILANVNNYLGSQIELTTEDIISSFSGVRPLVREGSKNSTKTSREHVILTPEDQLYVITGGKYTTCRVMAKQLVEKLKPV